MESSHTQIKPFRSQKAKDKVEENQKKWSLDYDEKVISWSNNFERIQVIREGLPFSSLEILSRQINLSVKSLLELMRIPQTTYNKKKKENSLMDIGDSELVVEIVELIDFGISVFNQENEKFLRWLKKPNVSLGGEAPENFLDTRSGILEVMNCLQRIESGSFA